MMNFRRIVLTRIGKTLLDALRYRISKYIGFLPTPAQTAELLITKIPKHIRDIVGARLPSFEDRLINPKDEPGISSIVVTRKIYESFSESASAVDVPVLFCRLVALYFSELDSGEPVFRSASRESESNTLSEQ